jgi:hypothetical protein
VGHDPPAACAQLDIPTAIERGAGYAYLAIRCTDTAAVGAAAHARWPDDPLLTYRHALWVAASGDWAAACALGLSTPAAIGWFEAPLARDYLSICRMARGTDAEATFHAMLGPEHPTSRLLSQRAAPNPDDPDLVNRAMWAMQQRTRAQGLAAMDDHMTSDVKSGLSHALAWSAWIDAGDRTLLEALTATYITVPNWHAMDGHETEQLASLIAVDGDVDAFLAMTADPDGRLARFRPVLEAGKAGNFRPYHRLLPTLGLHDQMALGLAAAVVAGPAATEDMRRRAMFGGSLLHQPMIGLAPSRSGR